jgi:hypothetical protein
MANVFKSGKMISNQIDSYLANAVSDVEMLDGALVKLGDLAEDLTYVDDGVEYDTYKAVAAVDGEEVAIVDYAGTSEGEIAGNNYKMGAKLYDLKVLPGKITRVRRLNLHDKFWLGEDNFESAPVVGKYAKVGADFKHLPAEDKPASGYAVKVLVSEDFTAGMKSEGKLYLCEVVSL